MREHNLVMNIYACTGMDEYGFINDRLVKAKSIDAALCYLNKKYPQVKKWSCFKHCVTARELYKLGKELVDND